MNWGSDYGRAVGGAIVVLIVMAAVGGFAVGTFLTFVLPYLFHHLHIGWTP